MFDWLKRTNFDPTATASSAEKELDDDWIEVTSPGEQIVAPGEQQQKSVQAEQSPSVKRIPYKSDMSARHYQSHLTLYTKKQYELKNKRLAPPSQSDRRLNPSSSADPYLNQLRLNEIVARKQRRGHWN